MADLMKGKVAAITGAASGIGLECARTLLDEGAKVVLVDRAQDKLEQLCKELGANALPLVVDPSGFWCRPEGTSYLCGIPPDPDPGVAPHDFEPDGTSFERDLWPLLASRAPGFEAARCTRSWVGHYDYNWFDQNAFVGPAPDIGNLLFACGFSGHGLQQAPAVGRGLAELVVHGNYRTLDLGPLGYERWLAAKPLVETNVI